MDPDLRGEPRVSVLCALSSPLRKTSMTVCRQTTCERCPLLSYPHPSLLSWRCIQWERPNALLEERERFIKDWRDCALSVFYWRLPAFLWACLLQQYGYVRLEAGGALCAVPCLGTTRELLISNSSSKKPACLNQHELFWTAEALKTLCASQSRQSSWLYLRSGGFEASCWTVTSVSLPKSSGNHPHYQERDVLEF